MNTKKRYPYYESVILALIERRRLAHKECGVRSMADEVGFSTLTIVNAIRRLVAAGRLTAKREDSGSNYKYKILIISDFDRQALEVQLRLMEK